LNPRPSWFSRLATWLRRSEQDVEKSLLDLLPQGSMRAEILAEISNPCWSETPCGNAACLDWRHWVPEQVRRKWKSLSDDARLVAFVLCAERATQSNDGIEPDMVM
jgi:hypothetical protein